MKLFYALWPDAGTRATFSSEDKTTFSANGGRLVDPDEFHLTVRYLGDVADDLLPGLLELGARVAAAVPASVVELDRVEWWQEPRVLVRVATQVPEPLRRLDEVLNVGLKATGVVLAHKPLKLHLTMVRNIKPHPIGTGAVVPLAWPADQLALVTSNPDKGPRYKLLGQWPFTGGT